ncbi:hypothetical protein Osc1_02890 [Hominimerdicola sp. 21CYCFAH17_S]
MGRENSCLDENKLCECPHRGVRRMEKAQAMPNKQKKHYGAIDGLRTATDGFNMWSLLF